MAENSAISWTDHTFNPWIGCTKVSPACDGCYAEAQMGMPGRFGPARVEWGAPGKGDGTRSRTAPANWAKVKTWDRTRAIALRDHSKGEAPYPAPVFVFCASLADVFDNAVPAEWRRDLFDLIRATPNLTWLLLTKRPGMIVKLWADTFADVSGAPIALTTDFWPRNAAIGCTVINQEEADRDIPKLLAAKAALNPAFAFLSMEPLLEGVDLTGALHPVIGYHVPGQRSPTPAQRRFMNIQGRKAEESNGRAFIDWVIAGGETDQGQHKARPADPAWFRSLRDQCAAAGVPFHFKQWGEWQPTLVGATPSTRVHVCESGQKVYRIGKAHDPCTLDGVLHRARPEVWA